jgi:hypothetical protein
MNKALQQASTASRRQDAHTQADDSWTQAGHQQAFIQGWLETTREIIPGIQSLVLLVEEPGASALRPIGLWPEGAPEALKDLHEVIASAASETGISSTVTKADLRLALAIRDGEQIIAVVAMAGTGPEPECRRALTLAAGWVAARLWQRRTDAERARFERGFGALDMMAVAAERQGLKPAAMALASELAQWLPADRVAIGFLKGSGSTPRLTAVSGGAWYRRNAPLAKAIEDAMGEAIDQDETVVSPRPEGRPFNVDAAQIALLDLLDGVAAASVPLLDTEGCIGAVTVLFDAPPAEEDLLRLEAIAALAGPLLALKSREERWISGRLPRLAGQGLQALGAAHRPSFRLATAVILCALIIPAILTGPLRLGADATLRGAEQRAVVAAVAGFISQADIRPGEEVQQGDLLLVLDDRDLVLEADRLSGEVRRLRAEARVALSDEDAGGRALAAARLDAAEAELALALARLDRIRIRAPVGGTVLSGDHRRRLGAPVEAGELLHEIAAGDGFRIELGIDERDLALVTPGMTGSLALAAEPGLRLPFTVTAITPVAREAEGRRLFTAEADLTGDVPPDLVAGMEGFARLEAGNRRLWSIWTRRARDWAALQLWRWQP